MEILKDGFTACPAAPRRTSLREEAMVSPEQAPVGQNHPALSHKGCHLTCSQLPALVETAMSAGSALLLGDDHLLLLMLLRFF